MKVDWGGGESGGHIEKFKAKLFYWNIYDLKVMVSFWPVWQEESRIIILTCMTGGE